MCGQENERLLGGFNLYSQWFLHFCQNYDLNEFGLAQYVFPFLTSPGFQNYFCFFSKYLYCWTQIAWQCRLCMNDYLKPVNFNAWKYHVLTNMEETKYIGKYIYMVFILFIWGKILSSPTNMPKPQQPSGAARPQR